MEAVLSALLLGYAISWSWIWDCKRSEQIRALPGRALGVCPKSELN